MCETHDRNLQTQIKNIVLQLMINSGFHASGGVPGAICHTECGFEVESKLKMAREEGTEKIRLQK